MNTNAKNYRQKIINLLITVVISMLVGAVLIGVLGNNPWQAYGALFQGAFVGKLNFGTTLANFAPLLLTAYAFIIPADASFFNCGVEGELYLGAITAAFVGYNFKGLPGSLHIVLCFLCAMIVGALWSLIPAVLKVRWNVNEVCVTILMNYVAMYIASYLVNGPMSAKTGTAQTPAVADNTQLAKFLVPSQANTGIFIAIAVTIFLYWMMNHSTVGYEIRSVGQNPHFSEYIGISPVKSMVNSMLISGAIGGMTGCIFVLGVYGYFLDNFSMGIAFNGMLAALIVGNDYKLTPFLAFFIAALQSGAQGMERNTGVPKSIVDVIISIFIIFATMEALFSFLSKKKKNSTAKSQSNTHHKEAES